LAQRQNKKELVHDVIGRYRAAASADAALDARAAERLGISATDLQCLTIVQQGGGVTAGQLAAASGLTTGAVTAMVDRLERAGYARRARDQADRRKVNVQVTPGFYARAEEIWGPIASDWERELGARFSADQLTAIADFLEHAGELATRHSERIRG
jgi:DNA-binding MarR family transcriptional regulator